MNRALWYVVYFPPGWLVLNWTITHLYVIPFEYVAEEARLIAQRI